MKWARLWDNQSYKGALYGKRKETSFTCFSGFIAARADSTNQLKCDKMKVKGLLQNQGWEPVE